jgi:sarcosine oxidase subunit beta
VIVVERETVLGAGSTGRNAGGVRHQFSSESNIRLSIESIRLFEHFSEIVGGDIDFRQDGYLFLLSNQQSVSAFRRDVQTQRSLGVDVEWLAPRDATRFASRLNLEKIEAATFCAQTASPIRAASRMDSRTPHGNGGSASGEVQK